MVPGWYGTSVPYKEYIVPQKERNAAPGAALGLYAVTAVEVPGTSIRAELILVLNKNHYSPPLRRNRRPYGEE